MGRGGGLPARLLLLTSISFPAIKRRKPGEMFCGTLGTSWLVLYILKIVAASRGFYPQILSEIQQVKQSFISDEILPPAGIENLLYNP